jgi:hypothetical protein
MIIESGPSLNVLGDRESFLPSCARIWLRFVVGLSGPGDVRGRGSVVGLGSVTGRGTGFPDIMAFQTASTSIVAALVSSRGFFSTFLHYHHH